MINLAGLHHETGDLREARRWSEVVIRLAGRHRKYRRQQAIATSNLALFESLLCEPSEAMARNLEALALAREVDDQRLVATVEGQIARLHRLLGDPVRAERGYADVIATHQAHGNRSAEAYARADRADLLIALGRRDEALADLDAARAFAADAGEPRLEAYTTARLAWLADDVALAEAAVATFERVGEKLELGAALAILGEIRLRTGDADAARALLARAHAIADEIGVGPASALRRTIARLTTALA